ncbi:hypothetical protein R3P38DRAFT_2770629 [Favolaschia claudopus]|uniref:Uncharacterized protein n=1 Tax=Favolaschia claudopus TaxID=2862362 RepID=A0AAW0CH17_9AGAR
MDNGVNRCCMAKPAAFEGAEGARTRRGGESDAGKQDKRRMSTKAVLRAGEAFDSGNGAKMRPQWWRNGGAAGSPVSKRERNGNRDSGKKGGRRYSAAPTVDSQETPGHVFLAGPQCFKHSQCTVEAARRQRPWKRQCRKKRPAKGRPIYEIPAAVDCQTTTGPSWWAGRGSGGAWRVMRNDRKVTSANNFPFCGGVALWRCDTRQHRWRKSADGADGRGARVRELPVGIGPLSRDGAHPTGAGGPYGSNHSSSEFVNNISGEQWAAIRSSNSGNPAYSSMSVPSPPPLVQRSVTTCCTSRGSSSLS